MDELQPRSKRSVKLSIKAAAITHGYNPFTSTLPLLSVSVPSFTPAAPLYAFEPFGVSVPAFTLTDPLYAIEPLKVTVPVFEPVKVNIPPLVFITLSVLFTVLE